MLPHRGMFLKVGQVASRICSRGRGRRRLLRDTEDQLRGDLATPDPETALYRSEQCVRVAVGIGGLEAQEQLASGLRRVRFEPGSKVVGDLKKGIRTTASTLRLHRGLCRRSEPPPIRQAVRSPARKSATGMGAAGVSTRQRECCCSEIATRACCPLQDLGQQPHRIEIGALRLDPAAHLLGYAWIGQKPVAGCRRRMIALAHPRSVALLLGELERRLEERSRTAASARRARRAHRAAAMPSNRR